MMAEYPEDAARSGIEFHGEQEGDNPLLARRGRTVEQTLADVEEHI